MNLRSFTSLALISLFGVAFAGGYAPTPKPESASFAQSPFCQQNGCQLQDTRQRYESDYQLYTLTRYPRVELEIYSRHGQPLGTNFSIISADEWSDSYALATAFIQTVFPGSDVSAQTIDEVETSTTKAAITAQWKHRPLILSITYASIPTMPSLKLTELSASTVLVGQ